MSSNSQWQFQQFCQIIAVIVSQKHTEETKWWEFCPRGWRIKFWAATKYDTRLQLTFSSLVEEFQGSPVVQRLDWHRGPFCSMEVRRGRKWRVQEVVNQYVAQLLLGTVATRTGRALNHPNTFLQQCQGRNEATAHTRGGASRRSGNSPQQEGGQEQAVSLDPLGAGQNCGNRSISDVPPIPFNLFTLVPWPFPAGGSRDHLYCKSAPASHNTL